MATAFNSYRVFYGLFFAESPAAKRHIQSRASSIMCKSRVASLVGKRQSIMRHVDLPLQAYKMDRAADNVRKRADADATHDILHYLRTKVIADQKEKFSRSKSAVQGEPSRAHTPRASGSFFRPQLQSMGGRQSECTARDVCMIDID